MGRYINTRMPRILFIVLSVAAMAISGCSASYDMATENPWPKPPEDEKRYLDISLDGKVGCRNEDDSLAPVPDLKVTMINANGVRTDSARTNSNGRFLIEHSHVAVGYYWEKHIYVEISDDRPIDDADGKIRYKTLRILKQIDAAPDNAAVLTMDDIEVKKAGSAATPNNTDKWNSK